MRRMKHYAMRAAGALIAVGLLSQTACSNAPSPDLSGVSDGQELPILREVAGTYSSITRPLHLVIHDAATLAALPVDPGPVDFDKEMVLFAATGPTRSERCAIRIRRVWRDGAVLRASVVKEFPPADEARTSTTASPFHLVVLRKMSLNVVGFNAKVPHGTFGR